MKKLDRIIMWSAFLAIVLLLVLAVNGAFCGARRAKVIFNSIPLAFYWFGLAVLLIAGLVRFARLHRRPGLFMIHAGCLLVLAGGMWGSETGHRLRNRFLGTRKIANGYMLIPEGSCEKRLFNEDFEHQLGELPFSIRLKDFRIEYYPTDEKYVPKLHILTQQGRHLQLVAKAGEEISLGQDEGRLEVIKTFRNFKIRFEDNKKIVTDEEQGGENPAVEVRIELPDGNSYTRYVFERFGGFGQAEDNRLKLSYISEEPRMIRDYFSDVVVIEEGKEILSKTIEVNHPLHYGGYHFYQHSYDSEAGKYTILSVTSDSGLYLVYSGYWMLCIGVIWQLWLIHIAAYIKGAK
jgi:hypothetical protein